jgi:hypothetical protein
MQKELKHLKSYADIARAKKADAINEGAYKTGDSWTVMTNIALKPALLSAFRRKAKDEHGKDLGEQWSDAALAEWLVTYVADTYLNIDSIPVGPIMGIVPAGQPGAQPAIPGAQPVQPAVQPAAQDLPVQPVQPAAQPAQPGAQAQTLPPATIQQ